MREGSDSRSRRADSERTLVNGEGTRARCTREAKRTRAIFIQCTCEFSSKRVIIPEIAHVPSSRRELGIGGRGLERTYLGRQILLVSALALCVHGIDACSEFDHSLRKVGCCCKAELTTCDVEGSFEIRRIHREITTNIRETDVHRACAE